MAEYQDIVGKSIEEITPESLMRQGVETGEPIPIDTPAQEHEKLFNRIVNFYHTEIGSRKACRKLISDINVVRGKPSNVLLEWATYVMSI